MKKFFFYLILFSSLISTGQTQQNINKNAGTTSNVIATIDSIRFNSSSTTMEVVLQNGTVESHSIAEIINDYCNSFHLTYQKVQRTTRKSFGYVIMQIPTNHEKQGKVQNNRVWINTYPNDFLIVL